MRAVFDSDGPEAVKEIANTAEIPSSVGFAAVLELDRVSALELALQHLGSAVWNLREFARGVLSGLFSIHGWPVLEESLK